MRFVSDFVDQFKDADLIIFANYNPVHPEILDRYLRKPIKILGFVDDPISTYLRGIQHLWAFDGAFYVSPSYSQRQLFKDALQQWGCSQSKWFPCIPPIRVEVAPGQDTFWPLAIPRTELPARGDQFFRERDLDLIYVGNQYGPKVNRLIELQKHFGPRIKIHGRWKLAGYGGMVRGLLGKPVFGGRVRPISEETKRALYYRTKIGFNMHFSDSPTETGNMRMYEVPAHGMMLLCDKAALNAHEQVFAPDKEAVFYDSIEDAIEKAEYYLNHDEERATIARAGFMRVHRDYDGESNLKALLDWAMGLARRKHPQERVCDSAASDWKQPSCSK
jgi:hypothetical protein